MRAELQNIVDKITKSLKLLEQRMDLGSVDHRLEEFNALSENPSFWQDQKKAQTLMRERQFLVNQIETYKNLSSELKENVDLIILGKQAIDDDMNATGQMVSAMLGWPQATFASKVEITDKTIKVSREVDGGTENIEVTIPAIITTDLRLNEPRYASLPNIMKAKKKSINEFKIDDLKIDIKQRLSILKVEEPDKRDSGIMVKTVEELVEKLQNEAKVI